MKHRGFASISALNQYLRYAKAHKVRTRHLLDKHDLLRHINLEEGRITGEQFQAFLVDLEQQSSDPLFGLTSALYVKSHSYTILGKIVEQSSTLGEAIEHIPVFERLVGDMGTTHIERGENHLILSWNCNYTHPNIIPHMTDNVLASWTLFAQSLTRYNASPRTVLLQRPQPSSEELSKYQRVFSAPVLFNQKRDSIQIDSDVLRLPLRQLRESRPNKNSQDAQNVQYYLEGKARASMAGAVRADESISESVTRAISAHLQLGTSNKELIAKEFSMSERNLQRRLASEGTSYRQLLDETRKRRAIQLLNSTELTTTEIAYNLGYRDERCFFRSLKKWTGLTPSEYQSKLNPPSL